MEEGGRIRGEIHADPSPTALAVDCDWLPPDWVIPIGMLVVVLWRKCVIFRRSNLESTASATIDSAVGSLLARLVGRVEDRVLTELKLIWVLVIRHTVPIPFGEKVCVLPGKWC